MTSVVPPIIILTNRKNSCLEGNKIINKTEDGNTIIRTYSAYNACIDKKILYTEETSRFFENFVISSLSIVLLIVVVILFDIFFNE